MALDLEVILKLIKKVNLQNKYIKNIQPQRFS
jgi:hypothetical protein